MERLCTYSRAIDQRVEDASLDRKPWRDRSARLGDGEVPQALRAPVNSIPGTAYIVDDESNSAEIGNDPTCIFFHRFWLALATPPGMESSPVDGWQTSSFAARRVPL